MPGSTTSEDSIPENVEQKVGPDSDDGEGGALQDIQEHIPLVIKRVRFDERSDEIPENLIGFRPIALDPSRSILKSAIGSIDERRLRPSVSRPSVIALFPPAKTIMGKETTEAILDRMRKGDALIKYNQKYLCYRNLQV